MLSLFCNDDETVDFEFSAHDAFLG